MSLLHRLSHSFRFQGVFRGRAWVLSRVTDPTIGHYLTSRHFALGPCAREEFSALKPCSRLFRGRLSKLSTDSREEQK